MTKWTREEQAVYQGTIENRGMECISQWAEGGRERGREGGRREEGGGRRFIIKIIAQWHTQRIFVQ